MNDPFSRGKVATLPAEMLAFATAPVGGADEVTVRHARGQRHGPGDSGCRIAENHVTIGASLVAFVDELQDRLENQWCEPGSGVVGRDTGAY
jgi:hypothetical protein